MTLDVLGPSGMCLDILQPAYALEKMAFNPDYQSSNPPLRETVARIVAVVAPVLYLYQIALYAVALPLSIPFLPFEGPALLGVIFAHLLNSIGCLFASTVEIPAKILFGTAAPCFFKNEDIFKRNYTDFFRNDLVF
jgi:hypothetical protein